MAVTIVNFAGRRTPPATGVPRNDEAGMCQAGLLPWHLLQPARTQSPELPLGSISVSFDHQKPREGGDRTTKYFSSLLLPFGPPLMAVGESLYFAIYHFGTRMKALAALLISSFSL